ncbi:MAG: hypothetical protein WBE26_03965 [Phycisphaerae bacterium]
MHEDDIPQRYRRLYRKAMAGRSLKAAIRAHCLMCVGWQEREVRLCMAPSCPLYPYRLSAKQKRADQGRNKRALGEAPAVHTGELVPV